ncbi:MAG: preprotein translocase subunit SecA [Ruminococcaceae bacterium]|nr:preprotein translocase subunit SecA [Oscillospiraceae bacterium]
MNLLKRLFGDYSTRELKRIQPLVDQVLALDEHYAAMDDDTLRSQTAVLKGRLAAGETLDDILPDAFAVCREAAWRVLGMKHFPVQIIGGIILHQGRIAEMKTGEGKTLVATLPSYLNALSGEGVHVVTVNDYLARRDSEWMGKVHRWLGLSVGLIVHDLSNDQRKAAYQCDITYGTNNEMGFDYLRDNMVTYAELKVQRGHAFAIVDEVDSILIDEARTPLIISGQGDKSSDLYERADRFASRLTSVVIAEVDEKQNNDDQYAEADYIVDEKSKTATLTQRGVEKAEQEFGVENLSDPENLTLSHHINQALKARGIMHRDVDYVVQDGEVIIVDEFTGRLMQGRRYSEGLHQAIEAKEGVTVARESKTLATITFQNFFRLYKKLSGMTGTALTEEEEFREIYGLDSIAIPTNRPVARIDQSDLVYRTEKAKFLAVIQRIVEAHAKGQPVLVGTVNIEKSEILSGMLSRRGIKHEVLNAKHHAKEAEIVAQAGKLGAVTIATNMAGRGTDINLGGNAEFLAKTEMRRQGCTEEQIEIATSFGETDSEEVLALRKLYTDLEKRFKSELAEESVRVREAGGLLIIGTERHESRRIDNQLRGRAGRQGDPGESQFYLSMEDDLMRLFGGDRMQGIMTALGADDSVPIDARLISNAIESAQGKVESRNFAVRKHVLQYDDVMNRQREIIYSQRDMVLECADIRDKIVKMIRDSVEANVNRYLVGERKEDWNLTGLRDFYLGLLTKPDDLNYTISELESLEREYVVNLLQERAVSLYEQREQLFGEPVMRELDRNIMLRCVDTLWMDHIDAMEELKRGIGLRAYGQHNPVSLYTIEGFDMFDEMIAAIKEDTTKYILTVQIRTQEDLERKAVAVANDTGSDGSEPNARTVRSKGKTERNELCPCGSGKKYKKCCGRPGAIKSSAPVSKK